MLGDALNFSQFGRLAKDRGLLEQSEVVHVRGSAEVNQKVGIIGTLFFSRGTPNVARLLYGWAFMQGRSFIPARAPFNRLVLGLLMFADVATYVGLGDDDCSVHPRGHENALVGFRTGQIRTFWSGMRTAWLEFALPCRDRVGDGAL